MANAVKYSIGFEADAAQQFSFDKPEYTQLDRHYDHETINGKSYTIPWKAVAVGSMDKVKAIASIKRPDLAKEAGFRSSSGSLPKLPSSDSELQLTVQGHVHQQVEEVTAYLTRQDSTGANKEETIGRLNVISYNKIYRTLVLVPVNGTSLPGNISPSQIQQDLNKIFGQAAVQWQVQLHSPALSSSYDENGDGLESGNSGLFSNYTSEMRTIIHDYKRSSPILDNNYYLFLVPTASDNTVTGFMPRKKQAGFVFTQQLGTSDFIKTIAHELAHGAFRLEHSFPELPQNGNNLLDYSATGTVLHKYQWDLVHDPQSVISWLQDDSESAALLCLGIFDDCDDVVKKLQAIKKAYSESKKVTGKMPYSAANRVLNANSIEIDDTDYNHLSIHFTGTADEDYTIDPKLYMDYDEQVTSALGGTTHQRGFAFKDAEQIVLKVLLSENTEEAFLAKKEALKEYLFGYEDWPENKIIIRLKRTKNNDYRTVGTINIDNGKFTGYILELPKGSDAECQTVCTQERKDENKCKRILKGEYKFEVTTYSSKEWAIGTSLRLHDIPGRSGVLIHRGVNARIWSEGCLLVVRNDPSNDLDTASKDDRANDVDDSHAFSTEIANYVSQREIEIKAKFKLDAVEKIIFISEENEIRD